MNFREAPHHHKQPGGPPCRPCAPIYHTYALPLFAGRAEGLRRGARRLPWNGLVRLSVWMVVVCDDDGMPTRPCLRSIPLTLSLY